MDLAVRLHLNQIWVVWRLCGTGGRGGWMASHMVCFVRFSYFAERNDWQPQCDVKCGYPKNEPVTT